MLFIRANPVHPMLFSFVLFVAGVVLLVAAGHFFVKGAVGLSEKLGVPPLIIGLTVVAFGTSAPELLTSIQAALSGVPGIAVGNIVGSNIANVFLVVGLPALVASIPARGQGLRRNLTVMVVLTLIFMWLLANGRLGHLEGGLLFLGMVGFIAWQAKAAQDGDATATEELRGEVGETPHRWTAIAAYLITGVVGLPVAAQILVASATRIAGMLGVSDTVIGLTIVAIGTSLPELAATFAAALKRNTALALGNVVGSNIFNMAGIMGLTALIKPLPVDARIIGIDMWVMLAGTALLALWGYMRWSAGRKAGIALIVLYAAYLASTVILP